MQDSMIFYKSFYDAIKNLKQNEQAKVYDAIFSYALEGKEKPLTGLSQSIFVLIKPQIDANIRRKINGAKGAEYGKKGGRPKKETDLGVIDKNPLGDKKENPIGVSEETPQGLQSKTPNVNVNVNENVNVNRNVNENVNEKKKEIPNGISKKEKPTPKDMRDRFLAMIDETELSDPLKNLLREWVLYKSEIKDSYKTERGFRQFLNIFTQYSLNHTDTEMIDVVHRTMSSEYKGVVWEWLDKKANTGGSSYVDAIKNRLNVVDEWLKEG